MTDNELTVTTIAADVDILLARRRARAVAMPLHFSISDLPLIATAIAEVARNILVYAEHGEIALKIIERGDRRGLMVIARDRGPGIADLERAMEDGFSTSGSLGLGLPGARRLMDEFDIRSAPGRGTTVTMTKWAQ
jgi:serine/threonine-protein kinase RsbT